MRKLMNYKTIILENLCYTELVYNRINKKLNLELSKVEIEKLVRLIIIETDFKSFVKKGKNIYVINTERKIELIINSNTYRIITANRLKTNT